jgi:hypothetical protein
MLVDSKPIGENIASAMSTDANISINTSPVDISNWALSHVLIWAVPLTDDELLLVSNILKQYLIDGINIFQSF